MADIGPRDELYMVTPEGKLDKMDPNTHHLEYLMDFYPEEDDYNEDFWDTIFDGGWIRMELKENNRNGWDFIANGKSLYRMKAIIRDNFLERLKRGENKVHIEEWTSSGMNPTHVFYLPAQKDELFDFIFEKLQAIFVSKTLNEIQNFERGLDPKKSIGIGRESLINKIPWQIDHVDEIGDDLEIADFILDYRGFPILVYDLGNNYQATSTMDYTNLCSSSKVAVRAMKRRIDSLLGKTDNKFKEKWLKWGLKENINFERGLEPKESMGIGNRAQLKKLDQETDWGFEISHAFHRDIWDIIKYNDHLIKITKVSGSDGIGSYMALNDTGEPYMNTPPLYPTPEEALDWEQKYLDQYDMGL
jgi:hypothetical protein